MKLLGSLLACLAAFPAAAATIVIQDGTFNPADWTTQSIVNVAGTIAVSQQPTGGNPNEYRRNTISWFDFTPQPNRSFGNFYSQSFDPGVSGAATSLSFSYDFARFSSSADSGNLTPLILQNNNIYAFNSGLVNVGFLHSVNQWNAFSVDASNASNWTRIVGAGPNNPDFASGAMQFGYRYAFSTSCLGGCNAGSVQVGIDNFRVTIGTADPPPGNGGGGGAPGGAEIPEPSTLLLSGGGLALLAAFRLRARR